MSVKVFNEVKKDAPELNKVYYGNKNLMSNYHIFSTILKEDEEKKHEKLIPPKESHLYYDNQAVQQVFEPHEDDGIYRHILAFSPFQRVYMDTMYIRLNNSTLAFINVIDLFSKFAYSKLFIIGGRSQAVTSQKSLDTYIGFLEEIKEYGYGEKNIGVLTLDGGSEFLGVFQKYLIDNNVPNLYTNPGDKLKTSPIERFNRTLRLFLEKYRVIYGKIDSSVLKVIMTTYNNIPHAKLKFSPIEILNTKEDQDKVAKVFNYMDKENHIHGLKIGQSVRILINRSPFQKIKPVWSSEIYTIKKAINNGNYILNDRSGYFHLNELQPINEDMLMNDKKVTIKEESLPPDIQNIEPQEEAVITSHLIKPIVEPRTSGRTVVPINRFGNFTH